MWRYLAGGVAALLMVAAGWLLVGGQANPEPALPVAPAQTAAGEADGAALPDRVPEASPRTREQKRFDRYDKDRDSRITRDEYLTSRRKAYAKLDRNGDGRLAFEEWAAATITKFGKADADNSGAMSAAEFATTAVKRSPRARPTCVPAPRED